MSNCFPTLIAIPLQPQANAVGRTESYVKFSRSAPFGLAPDGHCVKPARRTRSEVPPAGPAQSKLPLRLFCPPRRSATRRNPTSATSGQRHGQYGRAASKARQFLIDPVHRDQQHDLSDYNPASISQQANIATVNSRSTVMAVHVSAQCGGSKAAWVLPHDATPKGAGAMGGCRRRRVIPARQRGLVHACSVLRPRPDAFGGVSGRARRPPANARR